MIPMRYCGEYECMEVLNDLRHRLAVDRGRARQALGQIARLHVRQHGQIPRIIQVIGDPIYRLVSGSSKVLNGFIHRI